jgi:hypothetical protein
LIDDALAEVQTMNPSLHVGGKIQTMRPGIVIVVILGLLLAGGEKWYFHKVFESLASQRQTILDLEEYNHRVREIINLGTPPLNSHPSTLNQP